jgi:Protein of unknown function (DUF1350)
MPPVFRFIPVSFSWIAIHPHPKGVIQFIGGAFFGTFPTVSYRYFLQTLFTAGYTIVALPFRFSFRHWEIAIDLLKEQKILGDELAKIADKLEYESDFYQKKTNYYWLGHSLGCKYIALLEFLSGEQWQQIAQDCIGVNIDREVESIIAAADLDGVSIIDQHSLLIAPDISDTESAIPIRAVASFLDRIGWGVKPNRKQTQCFIERSRLFNLTALISFEQDTLAGSQTDSLRSAKIRENSDILWAIEQLKQRKFPILHRELPGKHLEPLGIRIGAYIVDFNPFDKFVESLQVRKLENCTIEFVDELKQRH